MCEGPEVPTYFLFFSRAEFCTSFGDVWTLNIRGGCFTKVSFISSGVDVDGDSSRRLVATLD